MNNELPLSKEQIMDAAEQVLRRFGPDKTSVMDVARALQVSHGTLYRHFPSKASLREAVTERWLEQKIANPLANIVNAVGESCATRLGLWLKTLVSNKHAYAMNDPEMFAMYVAVTGDASEMIEMHVDRLIRQIASIIEDGVRSKEFKEVNPLETARAIFLASSRFHHPAHYREWTAQRAEADFKIVLKLILDGISVPRDNQ